MAAVPITIVGTLTGKDGAENVTIAGMASITGLEVGGGPIIPSKPPGIWGGGNQPFPTPPIANVPGIDNPDLPSKPPEPIQPPIEWKAIWAGEEHGWVVVGIPTGDHVAPSK